MSIFMYCIFHVYATWTLHMDMVIVMEVEASMDTGIFERKMFKIGLLRYWITPGSE